MKLLTTIGILIISITIANSQNIESLNSLSKKMNFTFKLPAGYKEVSLPSQSDVLVNLAFKKNDGIEYRIATYPLSVLPKNIPSIKNEDKLNKLLYSMLYVICANISQNDKLKPDIQFFVKKEVFDEFGANAGLYATIRGNSDFSKGYKFVQINCLYRENKGMIIIYILFNDMEAYIKNVSKEEYSKAYYSIKFNK
jgi:hypothetical protein